MHTRWLITAAMLSLVGSTASAQDHPKMGVTTGYPSVIGVIWHATDKVAIRPDISLSGGSSGTDGSAFDSDSDRWTVGTGVSVLFYLRTYDRLRTYVSPSFRYSYVSSTSSTAGLALPPPFTTTSVKSTGHAIGGAGSFGAQYALADKFSLFGELGFGIDHTSSTSNVTSTKVTGTSWSTRTAVGVIFYP